MGLKIYNKCVSSDKSLMMRNKKNTAFYYIDNQMYTSLGSGQKTFNYHTICIFGADSKSNQFFWKSLSYQGGFKLSIIIRRLNKKIDKFKYINLVDVKN